MKMNDLSDVPIAAPPVAGKTINCLRCRHCKLLPHSNFAYESVPIHCKKIKRNMPLNLSPCRFADPRKYRVADERKRDPKATGDFTKSVRGVERLFLRHFYPTASMEFLLRATGRERSVLGTLANRFGVHRADKIIMHGAQWPHEQRAYIASCVNSTFWPKRGFGAQTERAEQIRNEVTERVNELGPQRSWLEIRRYAKNLTPAYFAREERKTARHKELQAQKRAKKMIGMSDVEREKFLKRSACMKAVQI